MKFLLDDTADGVTERIVAYPDHVFGQLITPLSRYRIWRGTFAVDNGCFGRFDRNTFERIVNDAKEVRERCLWVTCPDVIGNARRTLESFDYWHGRLSALPIALVGQDGLEDLAVPWELIACLFIGGTTHWKESRAVVDLIRTAHLVGVSVHIGRVNTPRRFQMFRDLGADTCDGSGVSRFPAMLDVIANGGDGSLPLFEQYEREEALSNGTACG